ncbi:nucleoporin Nup37-like [Tubulanus polymorphus]|uniref:nucleoporin Nup37-like n=1 Tax=Tubulanus polymorphus TaxID=672921 RepID=UPI003DA4495A
MPGELNDNSKPNSHSFEWQESVNCLEFSEYETSQNLLAIGGETRVSILSITLHDDNKDSWLEVETIREFHHGYKVLSICWSNATSLNVLPKCLRFCTVGADKKLRCFNSDLKSDDSVRVIEGHTDYINDVTFDPDKGDQIATVSDDLSCRIFDSTDGSQKVLFPLGSPGMSVCWHQEDPLKLMVAEKNGVIRFYNLVAQQPMMSLDCGQQPLLAADWCLRNSLKVAAVSATDLHVFDISVSCRPTDTKSVHSECATKVRWSRLHSHLLATLGRPGSTVKVLNLKLNQIPVVANDLLFRGLTWHFSQPMVAVGADKRVCLWTVESY